MSQSFKELSEKEKQTLRLIVRGHDAKSTARHLGLSVHTINERRREARRKLQVSSSREAARLLLDQEGDGPQNAADKHLGEAGVRPAAQTAAPDTGRAGVPRAGWIIAGAALMSLVLGILALAAVPQSVGEPVTPIASGPSVALAIEAEATRAAREWLILGDEGRWREGWAATGESFRKLNTVERWTAVAEAVRAPLGAVISRTALSQESVPAPPAGVEAIKFRTRFANKADAIETVALAREGGSWKVVGIYIE